jgi:glycosyltransferase involved in cell wall biosynthesis
MLIMNSKTSSKKVLLISFFFPPFFNPGSVRMGKFAKYLPEFDWEPRVLTVNRPADSSRNMPLEIDESYLYRTPYFTIGELISRKVISDYAANPAGKSQPIAKGTLWGKLALKSMQTLRPIYEAPVVSRLIWDPVGWYSHAVKKGREIIDNEKIDIIFSTYNPSLPHLIASKLNQLSGVPWVADYRDLWAHYPESRKTQPFQFFEEKWEKRVMRNCDFLISVSEPLVKDLELFHAKKGAVVYNGFDEQNLGDKVIPTSKFTITYVGQIYTIGRDPTMLFEALSELKREGKISSDDIEVRFFGKFVFFDPSILANKYGLQNIIKTYDFIPFEESIQKQMESTVLLLLAWNDPRSDGGLTSKLFEYMGAGKPILAFAYQGGDLKQLIYESGTGVVVNETSQVKAILIKWLSEFKQYGKIASYYDPKNEVIKRYSRREGTRKLSQIFDQVLLERTQHKLPE